MDILSSLNELITETENLINNLNTETKKMEKKYLQNRQDQLDAMMSKIIGLCQISDKISGYTPLVKLKSHPRYFDGTLLKRFYYIRLDSHYDGIAVYFGKDYYLGFISIGGRYEDIKLKSKFEIDDILDCWDPDDFEREFALEIERILKIKAEKANKEYEDIVKKVKQ